MLTKQKKEEMVKELEGVAKDNKSLVFVNFKGMNVADETILRRDLRNQGVGYKIFRKTLLKYAFTGKAEGEIPELDGEIAIAYSEDSIASPREIYNFQKTHKGIPSIVGGIFEGKFIGREKMTELAMIPSREVLYAQFVNLINSPIQGLVTVLDKITLTKPVK